MSEEKGSHSPGFPAENHHRRRQWRWQYGDGRTGRANGRRCGVVGRCAQQAREYQPVWFTAEEFAFLKAAVAPDPQR